MTPPLAVGHIGLTVPDLDAAVDWYSELFGFQLIAPKQFCDLRGGYIDGSLLSDVFGPDLRAYRMAQLRTANGTTLEMFEFIEPKYERPKNNFEYWRGGFNHLCVIDPAIEALAARIVEKGGRMRTSKVWDLFEGGPYKIVYVEDPWGSVIEIYNNSSEMAFGNRPV